MELQKKNKQHFLKNNEKSKKILFAFCNFICDMSLLLIFLISVERKSCLKIGFIYLTINIL